MGWPSEAITTGRLTLRCPSEDDRETITVILTDSEVRKHLGGTLSDHDLEGFRSYTIGDQSGAFVAVLSEFEEYGEPQTQVRLLRPRTAR